MKVCPDCQIGSASIKGLAERWGIKHLFSLFICMHKNIWKKSGQQFAEISKESHRPTAQWDLEAVDEGFQRCVAVSVATCKALRKYGKSKDVIQLPCWSSVFFYTHWRKVAKNASSSSTEDGLTRRLPGWHKGHMQKPEETLFCGRMNCNHKK